MRQPQWRRLGNGRSADVFRSTDEGSIPSPHLSQKTKEVVIDKRLQAFLRSLFGLPDPVDAMGKDDEDLAVGEPSIGSDPRIDNWLGETHNLKPVKVVVCLNGCGCVHLVVEGEEVYSHYWTVGMGMPIP